MLRSATPLTLLGLLGTCLFVLPGCAPTQAPVGSIGALLGRHADSRVVYVREVPQPAPEDVIEVRPDQLAAGDEILMVDGAFARNLTTQELRAKLRGAPGSEVNLTVVREGQVLRMRIKRTLLKRIARPSRDEKLSED